MWDKIYANKISKEIKILIKFQQKLTMDLPFISQESMYHLTTACKAYRKKTEREREAQIPHFSTKHNIMYFMYTERAGISPTFTFLFVKDSAE